MLSAKLEHSGDFAAALVVIGVVAWFQAPFLLDQQVVVERDALSSLLPTYSFLARALESMSWPLWNPFPVLGKPFLSEGHAGLFYPPNLWLLLEPFSRGFNALFVFHYLWTALGAFLLFRALGAVRLAAMVGALVWALGGPLISLGHQLNQLMAVSWLPWVLWGWARSDRVRSQVVLATLFLATSMLAGSLVMTLVIAAFLMILCRDIRGLAILPLAPLVAAAQLVPAWLHLDQTTSGASGFGAEAALRFSITPQRLVELFYPAAPAIDDFLPTVYLGAIPIALGLVGLFFCSPRSRRLGVLLALTLLLLALGSNTFVVPFLYEWLPGFDRLRDPGGLLVGVQALIALAATFGLTALLRQLPTRTASVAGGVILACIVADLGNNNRGTLLSMPPAEVFSPPEIARVMLEQSRASSENPSRYYASATDAPTPSTMREAVRLDQSLLYGQTGELYGLSNVNSPGSLNLVEHDRLQRSLEKVSQSDALATLATLGTKWITTFVPLANWPEIRNVRVPSGRAKLYRLDSSAPRAFIAKTVLSAPDARAALASFLDSAPELRSATAVVEGRGNSIPYEAPTEATIVWHPSGNNSLRLDVSMNAPALLVINDSFSIGWQARVDGAPTRIERVNGLVRGMWLTAGNHRVEMHYLPPGLPLGMALSLMALTILWLIWSPRRYLVDREADPQPEPVQPRLMFPRGS